MEENAQRWERLEELFAAAADLPRERQDAFVERETASDPELRRELRALLDHDSGAGQRIAQAIQSAAPPPQWSGNRAGPYRIVREIGRGGMGLVFEAVRDDDEYRKTVALKIAPWCRNLDLLRERFRRERQILAGLEHPNIARFLDGGTHDDTPYFAMEFVEGRPITEYAAGLKLREKIELFREVCAAVHYAHQSLVVHRDLKPANILVSEKGVPKLLDFGIAKLLGPSDADGTVTGIAPWTPDYASPEQIRGGPITTRTDVYSLGLILFEMLTGERAQIADSSSPRALDHSICEAETPRASTKAPAALARQLAGDLDTIVAKATHKEPERRYASVAEFSDDLGRFLNGRPVRAHNDSTAYRTSKFVRRNWLPVGATAVAMLGLAGGAIGFAWQARVANRSRVIAEQLRVAAEHQRDRVTQEHRNAEQQRDAAVVAQARAVEMAHEADTQRKRADERASETAGLARHAVFDLYDNLWKLSGSLESRRAMVQATINYLERLRADKGNDPEFEEMLGRGYFFMGDIQGSPIQPSLGDLAGSFAWYRKALAILTPLADQHPSNSRYQLDLCDALERIAVAFQHSGKDHEALEYYQKHLDASRRAAALAPDDPRAIAQVGYATRDLGLLLGASDPGRAEPYTREGLEVFQRLVKRDPENPDYLDNTATLLNQLATIASSRHELQQAADHIRQGADIREGLLKLKPDDTQRQRGLWLSYARLGDILAGAFESIGDIQGAVGYYRKSIALASEMLAKDPASKTAQSDLANLKVRLGSVLSSDDQRQESLELYSEALASLEAGLAASPKNALLRYSAGNVLTGMAVRLRSADPVRALECARRAIAHLTAQDVPANAEFQGRIAVTRQLTAVLLAEAGDRSGALEQSRQALNAYERQAGSTSPGAQGTTPRYWRYAGEMYYVLARKKEASPDQRLADWRAARDAYQRSAAEWRQSLAPRRQAELAQLEPKIAECEKEIAGLTH